MTNITGVLYGADGRYYSIAKGAAKPVAADPAATQKSQVATATKAAIAVDDGAAGVNKISSPQNAWMLQQLDGGASANLIQPPLPPTIPSPPPRTPGGTSGVVASNTLVSASTTVTTLDDTRASANLIQPPLPPVIPSR